MNTSDIARNNACKYKLLEMVENGEIDKDSLIRNLISSMSEAEVSYFARRNDYIQKDLSNNYEDRLKSLVKTFAIEMLKFVDSESDGYAFGFSKAHGFCNNFYSFVRGDKILYEYFKLLLCAEAYRLNAKSTHYPFNCDDDAYELEKMGGLYRNPHRIAFLRNLVSN